VNITDVELGMTEILQKIWRTTLATRIASGNFWWSQLTLLSSHHHGPNALPMWDKSDKPRSNVLHLTSTVYY